MTNTNISTFNYRYRNIERFVIDGLAGANVYYFFVGDHIPHADETITSIDHSVNTISDAYHKMILGKMIHSYDDVLPVIRYIPYETNKKFTMYDDQVELKDEDFYTITAEGSYHHIWKCLDNNNGSNSTVQPVFSEGANTVLYQTSDGYRWKYMTSVANSVVARFKTDSYFPVVANNSIVNNAVSGSLDTIKVVTKGKYYSNYIDGVLHTTDLRINGDARVYAISNAAAQTANGFYTGCLMYLTGGTGQGQFRTIEDYVANSSGNYILLDDDFLTPPLNGTTYEIRPKVNIYTTETPTINCVARALVNSVGSNSIYRIEVLQRGEGYVTATANITTNVIVGLTNADISQIRPILPPFGGHGSNIMNELFCSDAEVSIILSNTESNTVPATNQFQQIGIIRNPRFANVNLTFSGMQGQFVPNELIFGVNVLQLNTNCTVNIESTTITCNNANFIGQLYIGAPLVLINQDSTGAQLSIVDYITNSSSIEVTTNSLFTCTSTIMYLANVVQIVECTSVEAPGNIFIANCKGDILTGQLMIGTNTGAFGYVNTIIRNDVTKTFSTFNQLYKYNVTLVSGSFIQNEMLLQGNTSAYLHSVEGSAPNLTLYMSGFANGFFANGTTIIGNTSGAVAEVTKVYPREIQYGTGEIMYLENIEPIVRGLNQTEQFQIILNF